MRFVGPCLVIATTIVVADLHLGYEDRQAGSSGLVTDTSTVVDRIGSLIRRAQEASPIERVVLAGDVIDDFSLKSVARRVEITRALARLGRDRDLVLIKGNHDTMLPTLKTGLAVRDSFLDGNVLIAHGDRALEAVAPGSDLRSAETIVIGHEHPVLALSDGLRLERFKCFVRVPHVTTPYGIKEVIVMPSAHPDVLGTDVGIRFRSPVLEGRFPQAEAIVVGDPPRSFGSLGALFTQE